MAPMKGRVLVIAGSDCSGGAGLEADQKTLAAHGCYAMTATTALTVQNTRGVKGVRVIPSEFVGEQIEACVEDVGVDVVKTGMLATAETVRVVASMLRKHDISALVVDPVVVATSGARLLPEEALGDMIRDILPRTTILTPNIPEASALLAHAGVPQGEIRGVEDVERLARVIHALGPRWVLVKGGHLPLNTDLTVARPGEGRVVVDVLVGPGGCVRLQSAWQDTLSTHGTGCSLASAIAAQIARGRDVPFAVREACRYVQEGIREAPGLGAGHGPLNHFHCIYTLPFSRGYFMEYLLEHPRVKDAWREYVHHPFVMAMGNGTLPRESFKSYISQDYLFLIHFSRANALAAYKTRDPEQITRSGQILASIKKETEKHIEYCKGFGISEPEILKIEEHPACVSYTRYVLDVGQSQDWLALQMALAPCLLGYGALARMLVAHGDTVRGGNAYWEWIESYAGEEYGEAVRIGRELLEKHMVLQSPSRVEELVEIFARATKMEIGFWEMYPYC